jgi:hypothetical protein
MKAGGSSEPSPAPADCGGGSVDLLPPLAQSTPHPPVAPAPAAQDGCVLPTIEDVERLDADSDFSAFVTDGVDKAVQRLAMKKLFSDPHFHVMDGLDIYIDDYNKPDPLSAAMLASLRHAKNLFARQPNEEPPPAPGAAPGPAGPGDEPSPPPPPQSDA